MILTKDFLRDGKLNYGLRILLSAMFLLSAVAKLYPSPHFALTTFEIKQLLPMGFSELSAAYFSRTLIGCELALGIGFLQPHYFKRLVLPLSFLLLLIFSSQLTYELLSSGNKGNCGCFGSLLPMTPLQALIKNLAAMLVLIFLFSVTDNTYDKRNAFLVLSLVLGCILSIFLIGPLTKKSGLPVEQSVIVAPADTAQNNSKEAPIPRADKDTVTETSQKVEEKVKVEKSKPIEPKKRLSGYAKFFSDIDNGRKILCFFAPGCEHCKETAKALTQLKKQLKDFPELRIIFMDEEAELIPAFFDFAGAKYTYQILDVASFWQALGGTKDTPGIVYLWNGNILKAYDGINEKKFKANEFKELVLTK